MLPTNLDRECGRLDRRLSRALTVGSPKMIVAACRKLPRGSSRGQPKGKADPIWEVLGDDQEDEPKPCGALKGSSDFMRLKVSAKDPMFLQLDISVLQHRRKVPVLITAMSLDGAFTDEDGFDMTRASPLEDTALASKPSLTG
eukprot:symbB.v1.2.038116.t1/scaffold5830.1/size23279/3